MEQALKLVPVEPTEEMLDAYWHQTGESREMRERTHSYMRRYWSAMLAAAPPAPSGAGAEIEAVAWFADELALFDGRHHRRLFSEEPPADDSAYRNIEPLVPASSLATLQAEVERERELKEHARKCCDTAESELARLKQQLAEKDEALAPFAALADEVDALRHEDDSTCVWRIKAGDLCQLLAGAARLYGKGNRRAAPEAGRLALSQATKGEQE